VWSNFKYNNATLDKFDCTNGSTSIVGSGKNFQYDDSNMIGAAQVQMGRHLHIQTFVVVILVSLQLKILPQYGECVDDVCA